MLITIRRLIALGLLFTGLGFLVWASLPVMPLVKAVTLTPKDMQPVVDGSHGAVALLEQRQVRLEWPATMRIGDEYRVQLDFSPAAGIEGTGQAGQYADIYASHNVMAEAQVEASGVNTDPANPIRVSLRPGQAVGFSWVIRAGRAGEYDAAIWLSLRFLPLDGSVPSQVPVFVQAVRLRARSLLGASTPVARLSGGVGVLVFILLESGDMISLLRKRKATDQGYS